jgi:hypothetical protein
MFYFAGAGLHVRNLKIVAAKMGIRVGSCGAICIALRMSDWKAKEKVLPLGRSFLQLSE